MVSSVWSVVDSASMCTGIDSRLKSNSHGDPVMGYGKLWMKFVCTAVLACAGLTAIAAAPVVAGERTAQHTGTGLLDVVHDLADVFW